MIWKRKKDSSEFKPDANPSTWLKTSRLTQQQRLRLTKWGLYTLAMVVMLVIQDTIMSQFRFLGATTDLCACVILLITVIEGTEVGSVFVLLASLFYYFSGSAPGAYCVLLLTVLGVFATMLRQMYLHRSKGSILLCSSMALILYEVSLFVVGIFNELTRAGRITSFVLTGVYTSLIMILIYPVIYKIGLIGGNTWKE
ncbi:MAG: hypothetical protein J6V25_12240 [Oscillospiraceae bacterium]|nr:hypothetical protein [Oscillospiraceae bacterium]